MIRAAFILFVLALLPPALIGAEKVTAEEATALSVAQRFYDGYMKILTANGDTQAYVTKSPLVTSAFKTAYQAFMKDADSDPILCAQDYPDAGFKAETFKFSINMTTITMKSKDPKFDHSFKVFVVNFDHGIWKIDGTQDLRAGK